MKLNGLKTYIAGVATLMYAVGGYISGKLELNLGVTAALTALTMMGLRHGIGNKEEVEETEENENNEE